MASLRVTLGLIATGAVVGACAASQRPVRTLAARCAVNHTIRDDDTLQSTITRSGGAWTVDLTMRVRLDPDQPPIEIHGIGRVTGSGDSHMCDVGVITSPPGQPRFDADLCLDEFDSMVDLVGGAERVAQPAATTVHDVRSRRWGRRRRSRVVRAVVFHERAEITTDPQGRAIRIERATQQGGSEVIQVSYPSTDDGNCLPPDGR